MSKFASFVDCNQKFTIKSLPLLTLKEGEILVKNLCTSLCRSDLHTYQGKRIEKSPTILGHEIVGIIEAFGPNAPLNDFKDSPLKVGDKITWALQRMNFQRPICRRRPRIYLNMAMNK